MTLCGFTFGLMCTDSPLAEHLRNTPVPSLPDDVMALIDHEAVRLKAEIELDEERKQIENRIRREKYERLYQR